MHTFDTFMVSEQNQNAKKQFRFIFYHNYPIVIFKNNTEQEPELRSLNAYIEVHAKVLT